MTFNNPNYKLPNPMFKYKLSFKISKLANPKLIEYQFENELVFVPLIEKTNLLYFLLFFLLLLLFFFKKKRNEQFKLN